MRTEDFDYPLPPDLIAQEPLRERDASRLLVVDKSTGAIDHRRFRDLVELVRPGDRLVFNDTRVLPSRLFCRRPTGGEVELLFTERIDDRTWKALAKPGRRLKPGSLLSVNGDRGDATLTVVAVEANGERIIRLNDGGAPSIAEVIERFGHLPLPPYIRRADCQEDTERYQTVYAARPGAIAAPTAGLHFTPSLLAAFGEQGVEVSFITLHVGAGTFLPVKVADPHDHVMHEERFELSQKAAEEIMRTKQQGGKIIAVGTTAVRVLEHCSSASGTLQAGAGRTRLKILPPYTFKIVDCLITNFHLPKSTLLMLVSAFAGEETIRGAYGEAIRQRYRFFSYGDAMFIH
jgi:S-adenosylmethionine:tRNA ribosyltransferase-isomerase